VTVQEPFAAGDSILHRLDPRVKVIAAVVYSVTVAVIRDPFLLLISFGFSLALLLVARLDFRGVAVRLAVANSFVAFLWLVLPWTVPGALLANLGPVTFSEEGIVLALTITLGCNSILMMVIALLGTSRISDLAHTLRHLRVPAKLLMIFFFCIRFVHEISDEYHRLSDAIKIRAFTPGTNLRTYRTYANLLGVLLVRSYDRSTRVYQAMLCRGFTGDFPVLSHFKLRVVDVAVGAVVIAVAILLGGLQWWMTA